MALPSNFIKDWILNKLTGGLYGTGWSSNSEESPYGKYAGYWNDYNSPENTFWNPAAVSPSVGFSTLGGYQPQPGNTGMGQMQGGSLLDMLSSGQTSIDMNGLLQSLSQSYTPYYNLGRR